jgi:hypothetical protein
MGLPVDDVAPSKVTPFALRHTVRHAVKMAIPEVRIFCRGLVKRTRKR